MLRPVAPGDEIVFVKDVECKVCREQPDLVVGSLCAVKEIVPESYAQVVLSALVLFLCAFVTMHHYHAITSRHVAGSSHFVL